MQPAQHLDLQNVFPIEYLESRRLLASGTLDPTFSSDGFAKIEFGGGNVLTAFDVAVQADGKTVVAGRYATSGGNTFFAAARFQVNGSLDTTFSTTGYVFYSAGDVSTGQAEAIAIQSDGKIVLVGTAEHFGAGLAVEEELGVIRLLPNGKLDTSFDDDGKLTRDLGSFIASASTYGRDVAIGPNGTIYVVGGAYRIPDYDYYVMAFRSDGEHDKTFGVAAVRTIGFGSDDYATDIAIDLNGSSTTNPRFGQITINGYAKVNGTFTGALTRINSKAVTGLGGNVLISGGQLIKEFSGDGKLTYEFIGDDILIQPGGKTVVAGLYRGGWGIFRYNADGTLDTTFGTAGNGRVRTTVGTGSTVGSIIKAPSGGFIVTGSIGGKFAAVKYSDNGVIDTTWGAGGFFRTTAPLNGTAKAAVGPGKRIALAGGAGFSTARIFDHAGGLVTAAFVDRDTTEGTGDGASFFVGRSERLPFPTRVFFSMTGTATFSSTFGSDYQISGLFFDRSNRPYVDIPANETFTIVRIATIDDNKIEGTETAIFSITPNATYIIDTPSSATINIADNDIGTTVNLNGINDAYVRNGASANTNFGSDTTLQVKTSTTDGNTRLSYIKFDLSTLTNITTAKLKLMGNLTDNQNPSIAVDLFPVADQNWTGPTITFNNKPAPGTTSLGRINVTGTVQSLYQFDITNYIKQEKALGHKFVSFQLRGPIATGALASFVSGNGGANQPKLEVVTANSSVGVFGVNTPPTNLKVGQETLVNVKWTVPSGGWRQLNWIKLLVRDLDHPDTYVEFKYDESNHDAFYPIVQNGVSTIPAGLNLANCRITASGPASSTMIATFAFHFYGTAAGHRFALEVSAQNDAGVRDPYSPIGQIQVDSSR